MPFSGQIIHKERRTYFLLAFLFYHYHQTCTNKEIYGRVKKPNIIETITLNRLCWFGHVQRMEENRIPKRVLNMNFGTTRQTGRPRNRWQDEVREDGRIVGGGGWQEKVHDREEWKKLLRTARIIEFCTRQMNE